MSDPMNKPMKHAWHDVEEGFSTLGRMMRERYQAADGSADAEESEDEEATAGRAETDESGKALRESFERLVAAGRDLGDRAAEVIRDDEVKAQARRAAASLNDALSVTVDLIGEQVTGFFKGRQVDEGSDVPRSEPPAEDARQ